MTWSKEQAARAVRDIENAPDGRTLLGDDPEREFKRLSLLVHPDRLAGDETAMRRLQALRDEVLRPSPNPPMFSPIEIKVGGRRYELVKHLAQGEVADVYLDGQDRGRVIKVCSNPRDNDLLEAEAAALRTVRPPRDSPVWRSTDVDLLLPRLHVSFLLKTPDGQRRVNVLDRGCGMITLADVRAAYPDGLDYRDAAWMIRRLLLALAVAHRRGRIHGAVLPEHVLVHPDKHTALLVGWCASVEIGQPARLIVETRRDLYPTDVGKRSLTPATDIYLAGRCFGYLLGAPDGWATPLSDGAPSEIRRFINAMTIEWQSRRPTDAFEMHELLGDIMRDLCGPPTFRPLAMPAPTT